MHKIFGFFPSKMFVYGHEEDSMKDIKAIKKMKLHRNGKNSILN